MARNGRAGAALATSAIGSFVAGTLATIALMFTATALVGFAVQLGPPEYFAIMIVALSAVTSLSGTSAPKAVAATLIGLALGLVGTDNQTGQLRLTFGISELEDGIDVVLGAIGLFAVSEVLWYAATLRYQAEQREKVKGRVWMTGDEFRRSIPAWLRGSGIGFFIGALPGAGATVASFISYAIERRVSKHRAEFGKGAIEGVAGPEAANNAAAGGHLVPLLGLGIPGSGTTAVMLAAFQLYGLQPGPLLFTTRPDLVWGLIASLYLANVALLVLNLPLVGLWVKLLDIPKPLLYGGILVVSAVGVYSLDRRAFDLVVVFALGVLGFVMRRFDYPLAPVILGIVLGPLIDNNFRRGMIMTDGNVFTLLTRPLTLAILALAVLFFVIPFAIRLWGRARGSRDIAMITEADPG
jgi:putative tricarboxylic transport membrane protein